MNPTSIHEDTGSDSRMLWLWGRQAATAPIRPQACEPLDAAGVALKRQKDKKKKKNSLSM